MVRAASLSGHSLYEHRAIDGEISEAFYTARTLQNLLDSSHFPRLARERTGIERCQSTLYMRILSLCLCDLDHRTSFLQHAFILNLMRTVQRMLYPGRGALLHRRARCIGD